MHITRFGHEAIACRRRHQQRRIGGARKIMQQAGTVFEFHQACERHAIAPRSGQQGNRDGIDAAVRAKCEDVISGAAFKGAI